MSNETGCCAVDGLENQIVYLDINFEKRNAELRRKLKQAMKENERLVAENADLVREKIKSSS